MNLAMIVATDRNFGIGDGTKMPWYDKEDLQHFAALTRGHVVIMGRKTWESLPSRHGLPERLNVVVSRTLDPEACADEIHVVRSPEAALTWVEDYLSEHTTEKGDLISPELGMMPAHTLKVFCIGGGELYRAFLPQATEIHRTVIFLETDSPVTFPNVFQQEPRKWCLSNVVEGKTCDTRDRPPNCYQHWVRC